MILGQGLMFSLWARGSRDGRTTWGALRGADSVRSADIGSGPRAGLELVQRLRADARINADRRFHAVRGHLLEMAGDRSAALEAYRVAARVATNLQQQRYLNQQVTRLQAPPGPVAK